MTDCAVALVGLAVDGDRCDGEAGGGNAGDGRPRSWRLHPDQNAEWRWLLQEWNRLPWSPAGLLTVAIDSVVGGAYHGIGPAYCVAGASLLYRVVQLPLWRGLAHRVDAANTRTTSRHPVGRRHRLAGIGRALARLGAATGRADPTTFVLERLITSWSHGRRSHGDRRI
jgi:hypothetical protein